jgi:purine-binding chemotaxis protein CheW
MINTNEKPSTQSRKNANEESCISKVKGGKFLTFFLAGEEYGIEILSVQEIIGLMPITFVPGAPDYICGIINLRGKVIPIVDMRKKFGMDSVDWTAETCIIVVSVHGVHAGVVVDRVSEVLNIDDDDIDPAPSFGRDINIDFILGIGKSQSKVKILLDIDRVISSDQMIQLQKIASTGALHMEEPQTTSVL